MSSGTVGRISKSRRTPTVDVVRPTAAGPAAFDSAQAGDRGGDGGGESDGFVEDYQRIRENSTTNNTNFTNQEGWMVE